MAAQRLRGCGCLRRGVRQLYEGGFFKARLEFPKDFPNNPPTMTFASEMFHPNGESLARFLGRERVESGCLEVSASGLGLARRCIPKNDVVNHPAR